MAGLVVMAVVVVAVFLVVRLTSEKQRFAVFSEGQFQGLKGPGLLIRLPRPGVKWMLLSLDDRGALSSKTSAVFGGFELPVETAEGNGGPAVKIVSFTVSKLVVSSEK